MKKIVKGLLAGAVAAATAVSLFSFSACAFGKDGEDFSLYKTYLELKEAGEFSGTFSEFVERYLSPEISTDESLLSSTINAALLNVVSIKVSCEYTASRFSSSTVTSSSLGSGVVWEVDRTAGDATIVTNCHVIYDSFEDTLTKNGTTYTRSTAPLKFNLYLYGMEYETYAVPFTIVGYSVENDVAVLKVEDSEVIRNSLLTAVTVGDSDKVAVGDDVFLVGNACGEGISATRGIVSVESEYVSVYDATGEQSDSHLLSLRSIRTDAAANEGNSGGGFFNRKGELIGILFAGDAEAQGIGDCLPISGVKGIVNSILYNCNGTTVSTKKALIGITAVRSKTEQIYEGNRVTVVDTVTVSESSNSKISTGDVLLSAKVTAPDSTVRASVDKVTKTWQISDMMWFARVGDTVTLTVLRSGEQKTVSISVTSLSMKNVG